MSTSRRDSDPSERPLAFDGRDRSPRRGPAPVTLMISLIVLAMVGGGVFYLYRGGVRSPSGPPEPVGAPIRDVRVAAPPQPVAPDPAAGLSIYKDTPGAAQPAPKFAPIPEQPTPRPEAPVPAPAAGTMVATGPIAAAPLAAAAPASAPVVTATPAPRVKPVKTASIDSLLADAGSTAATKPAVATKTVAVPTKTVAVPAKTSGSGFAVQIGAFSSAELADKSWTSAAGIAPEMAGKGKHVAQMTKDGATLYRVAVTGFESRASAQAMCAKLIAAGRTCFVR